MTPDLDTRFVAGERFADADAVDRGLHDDGIAAVVGRFAPIAADAAAARATASAYIACARGLAELRVGTRLEIDLPVQANLRRSPLDVDVLVAAEAPIRLVKDGFRESATVAPTDPEGVDQRIRYVQTRTRAEEARRC
ncbi:hypothetical protein [Pseudonocardia kongjuensis]